jgi:IclR helix-turn-helix domain
MDRAANATKSRSPRTERASVAGAQSVFRALSILRQFSPSRSGVTGPELAASFGYSVPTANRLLRVLEAERFLVFDRATRRYCPGPEILRLSGMVLDRDGGVAHTLASVVIPSPGDRIGYFLYRDNTAPKGVDMPFPTLRFRGCE